MVQLLVPCFVAVADGAEIILTEQRTIIPRGWYGTEQSQCIEGAVLEAGGPKSR